MDKKEKIGISIAIGVSTALLSVYIFTIGILPENTPPPNLPLIKEEKKGEGQVILEINKKRYESEIVGTLSVYDFMTKLKAEGKIDFKDKTYPGMGKFIEEINGIKNGDKNWIYYVNGAKANIGVSNYKINRGDIVSWKYEK